MRKVAIPPSVLPGFEIISSFTKEDVEKLTSYLANIPVGKINNLDNDIAELFDYDKANEILKTITSFSELMGFKNDTIEDVAKNLCDSYRDMNRGKTSDEKIGILYENLVAIFRNYKNLGLALKARDLLLENEHNFHDSKIISDVRLIFDEDLENKKRHGVVIHRLHIQYRKERNIKEIFLALDMNDLEQLKDEIDRAIKKHEVIKNDYQDLIDFVY